MTSSQPTEGDKGNQFLGQRFGPNDGSRTVAAEAAVRSGVAPSILNKMVPVRAMLAAGYAMKQAGRGQGAFGRALGEKFGQEGPVQARTSTF